MNDDVLLCVVCGLQDKTVRMHGFDAMHANDWACIGRLKNALRAVRSENDALRSELRAIRDDVFCQACGTHASCDYATGDIKWPSTKGIS